MSHQIFVECPWCDDNLWVHVDLSDESGMAEKSCEECGCVFSVSWEAEVSHTIDIIEDGKDDDEDEAEAFQEAENAAIEEGGQDGN